MTESKSPKDELFAYLRGTSIAALRGWLAARVPEFARAPAEQILSGEEGYTMYHYANADVMVSVEAYNPAVQAYPLELLIINHTPKSPFAGWDNLELGKALADDLNATVLTDDGGAPYTSSPYSDEFVRITRRDIAVVLDGEQGLEEDSARVVEVR